MDGLAINLPGAWTGDVSTLPLILDAVPNTPNARFHAADIGGADGGNVSSWSDHLGGSPLALTTGAAPTMQTNSGEPVVRFPGGASALAKAYAPSTALTVMIVTQVTTVEINKYLAGFSGATAADFSVSGASRLQLYGTLAVSGPATNIDTGWHIFTAVLNGAASYVYLDAVSGTVGNPSKTGGTSFKIGHSSSGAQMDVAEIVSFEAALTSGQVATTVAALKAGHPLLFP